MGTKKSDELNSALADAIVAQPVASVEAAVQELRDAGLMAEADELAAVLAKRQAQLDEARAQRAKEEEAERQRAIAAAGKEFERNAAAYVELRDKALAALEAYVAIAEPGMAAYRDMMQAANELDLLTGDMVQRPETAQQIFNKSDAFKKIQHNAFSSQAL